MTFLLGKQVKSVSIDHPCGKLKGIESLPVDEANKLMARLRTGDTDVIDTLVRGHMLLAIKIAGKYAGIRSTGLADDLVSEALLAMAALCKRIANNELPECENITEYMIGAMHSRCANFVRDDRLLGASGTTKYRAKKSGKELIEPRVLSISTANHGPGRDSLDFGSDATTVSPTPLAGYHVQLSVSSDVAYVDLQDTLDRCMESERQREIMILKIEGYDIRSIAERTGIARSTVSDEISRVRKCVEEQLH